MRGNSLLSDLICLFDQGRYSHAALYDGQKVVEMLQNGTTVNNLADSIATTLYADVYRFVESTGKPFGSPGLEREPVLDRVDFYEQNQQRYGYEQIFLVAILCATRREATANLSPLFARILRGILDHAADAIAQLIHAGRQPMICSELVYRCYTEAGPTYAIQVRGLQGVAAAASPAIAVRPVEMTPDAASFQEEARKFLMNYALAKGHNVAARSFAMASTPEAVAAASAVADFITPHDLETSPSLQKVGQLG